MSRPLRIEYPDAWYHVMNRGRRKEDIFLSNHDYGLFIKVLQETSEQWNLKIAAYCLMTNHYHLLVQTPSGNISRCMRHINGVYTQRFNRIHGVDGQLFRGRYKAVLVEEDNYLLEVLRYIHKNPVRAGIVDNVGDFLWSSHRGYISQSEKWQWLHKDFLLAMLSPAKTECRRNYLDFIVQEEPEEIERFYSLKKLASVLGGESFKEWLVEEFAHLRSQREIPDSSALSPAPDKIITLVCDHFTVKLKELMHSRRGQENLPRDVAIYLVRRHSGETLTGVGSYFGLKNYSTVSSAVERIKTRKKNDPSLRQTLRKLNKAVTKGQKST
jgi:REP element-mobilizing transposase RayT